MRKNLRTTYFAWQYEDRTTMHQTKELEGNSQKKLTIPETSSEEPLEHSEITNSKNSFFCYSDVHTKIKNNPNQKQNENLDPALDFHKSDTESENQKYNCSRIHCRMGMG